MDLNRKVRSFAFTTKFTMKPLFLQWIKNCRSRVCIETVNLISCVHITVSYFLCDFTFKNNFQTNLKSKEHRSSIQLHLKSKTCFALFWQVSITYFKGTETFVWRCHRRSRDVFLSLWKTWKYCLVSQGTHLFTILPGQICKVIVFGSLALRNWNGSRIESQPFILILFFSSMSNSLKFFVDFPVALWWTQSFLKWDIRAHWMFFCSVIISVWYYLLTGFIIMT